MELRMKCSIFPKHRHIAMVNIMFGTQNSRHHQDCTSMIFTLVSVS